MTTDARKAWLAGLKVGDEVISNFHSGGHFYRGSVEVVDEVMRFTPQRVVMKSGHQFSLETARAVGGYGSIRPITDDDRKAFARNALESSILRRWPENERDWAKECTDEELTELRALLARVAARKAADASSK